MGGVDKQAIKDLEAWCAEARRLLNLAVDQRAETPEAADAKRFDAAEQLMTKGRELAAKGAPDGAGPSQRQRFDDAAKPFAAPRAVKAEVKALSREQKAARFNDEGLDKIGKAVGTLTETLRQIHREQKRQAALRAELDAMATAVPGATLGEQADIDKLREAALKAITDADDDRALDAAAQTLPVLRMRLGTVAQDIAERAAQAKDLLSAAELPQAPPELPTALDAARTDVKDALAVFPLTEGALKQAAAALTVLEQAAATALAEAVALRQLRSLYGGQLAALQARLNGLGDLNVTGTPKTLKSAAGDAATAVEAARDVLAPARTRQQTETFPARLALAEAAVLALLRKVLVEKTPSRERALGQLQGRLAELRAQAALLPSEDNDRLDYTNDLKNLLKVLSGLVGPGASQQERLRSLDELDRLASSIAQRRAEVGIEQQLFQQRRGVALATMNGRGEIPGCLPAHAVELAALRQQLGTPPPLRLTEVLIGALETAGQRFEVLWPLADADARLAAQVEAVWGDIDATKPQELLAGARPAARREVQRAHDIALQGRQATDAGRDMPRTLALSSALLLRLRALKAEPAFDDTAAVLGGIPAEQRRAAHDLCGPALLGKLDNPRRGALAAVVARSGPAIETLVLDGLGGQPALLDELVLRAGPAGLERLALAFAGGGQAANRKALLALVEQGGLAQRPAIIARLLGPADEADADAANARAAGVRSLAQNFADADGPATLGTLLGDCGLGADPAVLPALMHEHGLAGDGKKLREFADAFAGDGAAAARVDLNRLVTTGGIAQHPKAFAPLAARGGAARVKSIGAAFTAPDDCVRLKALLDGGGLSGDAGSPGHEHEHPQTLEQLVADGFKGNAVELRDYARAFGGPGGPARSRDMLGAFNAYGAAHGDARQPGQAVAALLDGTHFQGSRAQRIDQLATRFVPEMQNIADPVTRGQAFRTAPHLRTATAEKIPPTAAMLGAGVDGGVTSSVSKRHRPESASLAFAKLKGYPTQSLFPPGSDLAALAEQALVEIAAGRTFGATLAAAKRNRVSLTCPRTGASITVEVDTVVEADGKTAINHFGPRNDPPPGGPALTNGPPHPDETPRFTQADVEAMYKSLGLPT